MPDIIPYPFVWATTSTSGTGAFTCTGAVTSGGTTYVPFSVFANGSRIPISRSDSSGAFEEGCVTISTSGGVSTLTWEARYLTSAGGTTPVNWAAGGTQNVRCLYTSRSVPIIQNGGSEYAAYASTFRGYLGLGTSSTMAASRFGLIDSGQSGGTTGKFVRPTTTANTWADASTADSTTELWGVGFKSSEGIYVGRTLVSGFSGLVAGTVYCLGSGAGVTYSGTAVNLATMALATAPSSSVRLQVLGRAISTTQLLFSPGEPVTK